MITVEQARASGKPIHVPSGEVKGWEVGNEFVKNPDYTPPVVVQTESQVIVRHCQKCGVEMKDKGNPIMRGLNTFYVCEPCVNNYAL